MINKLFVDGSSAGNPGPAGIAMLFVNENGVIEYKHSQPIGIATNNEAEYEAVLYGLLTAISLGIRSLQVFTDSKLVYEQIRGSYKVRSGKLATLREAVIGTTKFFDSVSFFWIPEGENTVADRMAKEAARRAYNQIAALKRRRK